MAGRPGGFFLKLVNGLFNSAVLFVFIRNILNLGTLKKRILRHLRLKGNESILDVGCGAGEYSGLTNGEYLGMDYNGDYIRYASRVYGSGKKKFVRGDVTKLKAGKKYDLGLFISMLHHFSEKDALRVLKSIARLTRRVLVADLLDSPNPFKHFLITMDRGRFVRPLSEQKRMLGKVFRIVKAVRISTNSGSADLSLFILKPKRNRRI